MNFLKTFLKSMIRRSYKSAFNLQTRGTVEDEIEKLFKARKSLGHVLNDTQSLKSDDYELIGRYVQTYCIADLEARRVINCLRQVMLGNPTSDALKLGDKDVLNHLLACSESCVWDLRLAADIGKAAKTFVMHRKFRHMFAHWAGRRIPNHDAYIFFTSSLTKQKLPINPTMVEVCEDANMQYGILPISNLIDETSKLEGHAQYLASIASELERSITQITEKFAKDVAEGRLEKKPYIVQDSSSN